MSIPPPSFNDFVEIACQSAKELQAEINKQIKEEHLTNRMIASTASLGIREVISSLERVPQSNLKNRELEILLYDQVIAISEIQVETLSLENDHLNDIDRLCDVALRHLDNLQAISTQKSEVEKKGLDAFLNEDWAQNEFKELLKQDNKWAMNKLNQMLEKEDEFAFQCLWSLAAFKPKLMDLLLKKINHSHLKKALIQLLKQPFPDDILQVIKALADILIYHPQAWLDSFVKDRLVHNEFISIELFTRLLKHPNCPEKIFQLLLDQMTQLNENVVEAVQKHLNLVTVQLRLNQDPFLSFLMDQTIKKDSAKIVMMSLIFSIPNPSLKSIVSSKLSAIAPQDSFHYQLFDRLYTEAEQKDDYLIELEEMQEGPICRWSRMPVPYRFGIFNLLLSRITRLIHFFLNIEDSKLQTPKDFQCSDYYPKTSRALVGIYSEVNPILDLLKEIGVETFGAQSYDDFSDAESYLKMDKSHVTRGATQQKCWVRDYFFQNKDSIRLPPIDPFLESMQYLIDTDRSIRQPEGTFDHSPTSLGGSIDQHQNISFYEHLRLLMDMNAMPSKSIAMQFGTYEGGNVALGDDYIILGKDSYAASKQLLQNEMAKLGLRKSKDKWHLEDPYLDQIETPGKQENSKAYREEHKRCYLKNQEVLPKMSDDEYKDLIAVDFGLQSGKDVYLVEQPEYHLDVALSVVDPKNKIVLLNDSELAAKELRKSIAMNKKRGDYPPNRLTPINENLKLLTKWSDAFKNVENKCERDLIEQGFQVIRLGGAFDQIDYKNPPNHRVNFFNYLTFTDEKNQKHLIALGTAKAEYKIEFEKIMNKLQPDAKVHYADVKLSERLLSQAGGLHCLVQMIIP